MHETLIDECIKELYDAKLPVPVPLGHNRGAVAMEYINSIPLFKFSKDVLENGAASHLYSQAKELLIKMAQIGLVHGDFNEFNLLVEVGGYDALGHHTVIDLEDDDDEKEEEEEDEEELSEESEDTVSEEELNEDEEDTVSEEVEEESSEEEEENKNLDCPYINQDVSTFKLRLIDFPQVISRDNKTAQE